MIGQFRLAAALLLCAWATPALAQDADKGRIGIDSIHQQLTDFGAWLQKLTAAVNVGTGELEGLQGEWQRAMREKSAQAAAAQFRPILARARSKLAESDAALRALETPSFPALQLEDDTQPTRLVTEMLALNGHIRALVDSFEPLLQAMITNDPRATIRSGQAMMNAARLLLDSQALLAGATAAASEPESSSFYGAQFQQLLFQTNSRMVQSFNALLTGKADTRLKADLTGFADRVDAVVAKGNASVDVDTKRLTGGIATIGDAHGKAVLEAALAVVTIERRTFAVAHSYALQLRQQLLGLGAGGASMDQLKAMVGLLRPARDELNAIIEAQNAALARTR